MSLPLKPGEVTSFTVPDTQVQIPVRKVSYALLQEVQTSERRKFPAPQPPVNEVDYGDGLVKEPNLADPDYLAALKAHDDELNARLERVTRRLLIKRGVTPFLDWDEEKQAQVDALRQEMREDFGTEIEEKDDKVAWVVFIALGSMEDWGDFITFLTRRSLPTEEAIQEQIRKF